MSVQTSASDLRYAIIARRHGMSNSLRALWEARKLGINPSLALAVSQQESDGKNVFGHDKTIFIGAGKVTKQKYLNYKALRKATGKMQGVGPLQLTWWEFQDAADKLGGCWKTKYNFQIGYGLLARLVKAHGKRKGLAIYNGGSARPNYMYADQVLAKEHIWHNRLKRKR
jgi:hypothetical protein